MRTKKNLHTVIALFTLLLFILPLLAEAQTRAGQKPDPAKRSKNSLSVTPMSSGITAQQMVNNILGAGIISSNVQYIGAPVASGIFSGGSAAGIGVDEGIILSSGAAQYAIGPNNESAASKVNGLPGDANLNGLGYTTFDASVLEFDFIPEQDAVSFSFVLGSEEYPEFINGYPDVFGFFLDGVNLAYVPGTTIPISIGTINHQSNSQYYISNNDPVVYDIQCDGFTVAFQLSAEVTPNVSHHIKMAIADVNDHALDSWIFLQSGSFVGVNLPPVAQGFPATTPEILVGETYNLSFSFNSPEPNQITEIAINPQTAPGLTFSTTSGAIATGQIELVGSIANAGMNTFEIVATDDGTPPMSTTVMLNILIINPAPVISVDPLSLSESLYPGETSTQTLTISNNGASDLTVDLEDIETSKRMKIKSVKPKSGSGDNSDDFMNYLNRRAAENAKSGKLVGWLAEAPLTGVIAPGASLEIEVAFDATELSADIYSAQILINSNDPATPQVVVPVTLEVMAVNCSYVVTNDNENNALAGVPDYDMDVYLFNDDYVAPIEFNIFVLDAVIDEAQLNLYAWDVDESQGEIDEVYVNGTLVGTLTGANSEWSTSVFYLDPALINIGKNLIQVIIDINNEGWAVNVDWGQLIINNCMGGNAYIRYAETDNSMYPQGANVEVTVEVDTDLEQQIVIIETNLLDENNINVAGTSATRTISLQADEPLTVSLAIPPTATLGANYHAQVIVYDATTYVQQDLALVPFFIWGGQGILNCLDPGWHLISSPYFAQDPDLDVLMAEVNASGALVIMLNKYGIYWPVSNINMLGDWNNHHGYKIKMAKAACIIWDGDEVMDKTVNLTSGIDYLPVLSTEPAAAADVFSQIEGNLIYAFDIENGLIYWPNGGIFTLQMLNPGEAYLINMMSAGSVTYPFEKQAYQASPNKLKVINNAPYTVTKTGSAHFITIKAEALQNFSNGDIVAAFNPQGTCVGMAQYNGDKQPMALAVYADDFTTEAIDGMGEGDVMQLAVYSPATLQQKVLQPVWNTSMTHTELFAENALSEVIDFKDALGVNDPAIDMIRIYPNPSTGIFTVTGANESVRLEILNAVGQQMQLLEANGSVQIDLSAHAKGIYYLRMISQQSTRIQKIVVE